MVTALSTCEESWCQWNKTQIQQEKHWRRRSANAEFILKMWKGDWSESSVLHDISLPDGV